MFVTIYNIVQLNASQLAERNNMVCIKCNDEMDLDDKDVHSKGNYDKYWVCTRCDAACIEEIRKNKEPVFIWSTE